MTKFVVYTVILIAGFALIAWLGVRDTLTPLERSEIVNPVYAIGEAIDLADQAQEKKIVKFGPAFWGQYPGGRAFPTVAAAEQYLVENNKLIEGWAIYQLSGDFALDTYLLNGAPHLNKSLAVIRLVKKPEMFSKGNVGKGESGQQTHPPRTEIDVLSP